MQTATGLLPPQPPEKEDGVEGGQRSVKKFWLMKRSFAETAAGPTRFPGDAVKTSMEGDWFDEGITVDSDNEDDALESQGGIPVVKLPKALRKELVEEWKNALIVKYLGKPIAFQIFYQRLVRICGVKGKLDLIDVGFGCYVARFDDVNDCKHVLMDEPWKLFDNYIVTQRWRPDFDPKSSKMEKMAVWVRLPGLPVEYFCEDVIHMILQHVGTPLKLDKTTAGVERGRFARAAIEIDLSKPLVLKVMVRKRVQLVGFEGLHVICFTCGQVGHRSEHCPEKVMDSEPAKNTKMDTNKKPQQEKAAGKENGDVETPKYGPWMMVNRKQRKHVVQEKSMARKKPENPSMNLLNQFAALSDGEGGKGQGVDMQTSMGGSSSVILEDVHARKEKGKFADMAPDSSNSDFLLVQDLEGLLEAPIWVEGKRGLTMGTGNKGRGRSATARRHGDSKMSSLAPFDSGSIAGDVRVRRDSETGHFIFGQMDLGIPPTEPPGKMMMGVSADPASTLEEGGNQISSSSPMDQ